MQPQCIRKGATSGYKEGCNLRVYERVQPSGIRKGATSGYKKGATSRYKEGCNLTVNECYISTHNILNKVFPEQQIPGVVCTFFI